MTENLALQNHIFGLDEQQRTLEKVLLDFKQSSKGGSCLLSGRKYTGKTLLLDAILDRHFHNPTMDDKHIRVEHIDGNNFANFAATTKIFERLGLARVLEELREEEQSQQQQGTSKGGRGRKKKQEPVQEKTEIPHILFIIDHFEMFTKKSNQNFLYSILNGSQDKPWFVLLIGNTEGGVSNLEKRVRSRLSKQRINFNVHFTFEQFQAAFQEFIGRTSVPADTVQEFLEDPKFTRLLQSLHDRHPMMGWLKKWVALFEVIHRKHGNNGEFTNVELLSLCLETLLPERSEQRVLSRLSTRQLCLLNCMVKLEESRRRIELIYREIVTEYYRFAQENMRDMSVRDVVLFKDLDELVALRLIVPAKRVEFGQLQFKKVVLNVEQDTIQEAVEQRKQTMHTDVYAWFTSGY